MSIKHDLHSAILKKAMITILAITWLGCLVSSSIAQRPSTSRYSLAVDEVTLTSGKKMYGIVMQQNPQTGLKLLVERAWFEKTYPKLYASHFQSELQSEIASCTKQLFRLEAWWKSRVDDAELVAFIDQEMERVEKERDARQVNAGDGPKPFTWVDFPAKEISKVFVQSAEHHKIAGLAWKHKIERVTSRSVTALKRELENLNVDTNTETFDLSSQLPGFRDQSESEWNARVALIEYQRRTQLEFQGIGSTLIRTDANQSGDQNVDVQDLIRQMLGSGLAGGNQVDELLNELGLGGKQKSEQAWWKKAAEIAETENVSGFLVTRVVQDASNPTATVENCFFAQVKPGQWKQVVRIAASANRNDVDQANVDRIKDDPQVKKVLGLTKRLGLDSTDVIEQAIRQGAATETALFESRNKFFEFLNQFTKRTDGPMLSFE